MMEIAEEECRKEEDEEDEEEEEEEEKRCLRPETEEPEDCAKGNE